MGVVTLHYCGGSFFGGRYRGTENANTELQAKAMRQNQLIFKVKESRKLKMGTA